MLTRIALFLVLLLSCWPAAKTEAADGAVEPAIIVAAKAGDLAQVEALLDAGADPNAVDAVNNTALIFAARDGHLAMAELLIARGTDIDWLDDEKVSALILAAFKGHREIARLLLAQGADPSPRDIWGRQALDYALRRGPDDPIALMIQNRQ